MKKIFITIILCWVVFLNAQIVDIPDVNFKNALVNTKCVDIEGNGSLEIADIKGNLAKLLFMT
jgi:hypothetical protein